MTEEEREYQDRIETAKLMLSIISSTDCKYVTYPTPILIADTNAMLSEALKRGK